MVIIYPIFLRNLIMITLKITFFFIKTSSNYSAISSLQIQQNTQVLFPESFHPVYIEGDVNHIHYENQLTQIHLEVDYNLKNLLQNRKRLFHHFHLISNMLGYCNCFMRQCLIIHHSAR